MSNQFMKFIQGDLYKNGQNHQNMEEREKTRGG